MKRNIFSLLIAVVAIAFATIAIAQDSSRGKGQNAPVFSVIDVNGDGAIEAEEFYQFRSQRMAERAAAGGNMKNAANAPTFEDIDTNGDGGVSPDEFTAFKAERMANKQAAKNS